MLVMRRVPGENFAVRDEETSGFPKPPARIVCVFCGYGETPLGANEKAKDGEIAFDLEQPNEAGATTTVPAVRSLTLVLYVSKSETRKIASIVGTASGVIETEKMADEGLVITARGLRLNDSLILADKEFARGCENPPGEVTDTGIEITVNELRGKQVSLGLSLPKSDKVTRPDMKQGPKKKKKKKKPQRPEQ